MGGLAVFFEEEGLPTTLISLIREHSEKIAPPRALWVPFELGRPLGAPDKPEFQKRVLISCLELLEADSGPVHTDFPDDAPEAEDITGWACPINLAPPDEIADTGDDLATALEAEVAQLATWYDLGLRERKRTAVGISGLEIDQIVPFVSSFLGDDPAPSPREDMDRVEVLKLACDDLRAFCIEAATAQPGHASSTDLNNWFWRETVAGKTVIAVKAACLASSDETLRYVGLFLVPRAQAHLEKPAT